MTGRGRGPGLAPPAPRPNLGFMTIRSDSLRRDDARGVYELPLEGDAVGLAVFRKQGDVLAITHTETPPHLEGRGYGSALMKAMLDDVRARGEKVRPLCSFARAYMQRRPETHDLLA